MNIGLQITKNVDKYNKLVSLLNLQGLEDISLLHTPDDDSLKENIKDLDILVCYKITPDLFHYRSYRLKWIHIGAAGVDGNLFQDVLKSKVMITNSKGINSRPVAEFIMSQMLYPGQQKLLIDPENATLENGINGRKAWFDFIVAKKRDT